MNEATARMIELIRQYPQARVVTDVGASMISGWGNLKEGGSIIKNTMQLNSFFD